MQPGRLDDARRRGHRGHRGSHSLPGLRLPTNRLVGVAMSLALLASSCTSVYADANQLERLDASAPTTAPRSASIFAFDRQASLGTFRTEASTPLTPVHGAEGPHRPGDDRSPTRHQARRAPHKSRTMTSPTMPSSLNDCPRGTDQGRSRAIDRKPRCQSREHRPTQLFMIARPV